MDNVESSEIIDNVSAHRFEVHAGGSMARLDYRLQNRTIVLVHTEVPPELENCGIGAKLVKAALEYARQSSLMVVSHCSFADAYIRRHPQYQAQVEPAGGMR